MALVLSKRLQEVANKVRTNTVVADIGCDHGYLCSYLVENNICSRAIAADINIGPLKSAKETVEEHNLSDKIDFLLCDGLSKINSWQCDDIVIAGMGGELIVKILEECDWVKDSNKHYVFQPMTHPEILIEYLVKNGFDILSQDVVFEDKHCYTIFDAKFSGIIKKYDRSYYYIGEIKDFKTNASKEYFKHLLNFLNNKMKGSCDYSDVINAIKEKL